MMRVLALVAIAAGCGRVGFGAAGQPRDGDGVTDAGPRADAAFDGSGFVISATSLTSTATLSWVDVDVDWDRQLAYVSSREPGTCFAVVDISATPTLVRRFGPPQTTGATCLGVSLDNTGQRLLVASESSGQVELWDLGTDPRAGSYSRLGTLALGGARRIARDHADPDRFYVPGTASLPGLRAGRVLGGPPWLQAAGSYTAPPCPNNDNDATALASGLVLFGCATDFSPAELVDGSSMTLVGSIPATPPTTRSGFWSAARTQDGSVGVLGGWVTVVVTASGATGYALAARLDNDDAHRGMTIADRGSGPEIWGARSDGQIEVISIAEPADPVVVARAPLGVMGEAYAVRVSAALDRAIVVTNRSFVVVGKPSGLTKIDERWPAF